MNTNFKFQILWEIVYCAQMSVSFVQGANEGSQSFHVLQAYLLKSQNKFRIMLMINHRIFKQKVITKPKNNLFSPFLQLFFLEKTLWLGLLFNTIIFVKKYRI